MVSPMQRLISLFTEHPATVNETYLQHLMNATGFALRMIGAGMCCLVHGLFPFLFVRTGSSAVTQLHDRMVTNRARRPAANPHNALGPDVVGTN